MAQAEKRFIWCFQEAGGNKPPFLAELIKEDAKQVTLKVGRKEFPAHRAACSSISYSQADLEKYNVGATAPIAVTTRDGKVHQSKPNKALKGFFGG